MKNSVIFFWDTDKKCYVLYEKSKDSSICLQETHPLIKYFRTRRETVFYKKLHDDLVYYYVMKDEYKDVDIKEMLHLLKRFDAELCVPIIMSGDVKGIWIVGEKISKEALQKQERKWIENVAAQETVKVENISM